MVNAIRCYGNDYDYCPLNGTEHDSRHDKDVENEIANDSYVFWAILIEIYVSELADNLDHLVALPNGNNQIYPRQLVPESEMV